MTDLTQTPISNPDSMLGVLCVVVGEYATLNNITEIRENIYETLNGVDHYFVVVHFNDTTS